MWCLSWDSSFRAPGRIHRSLQQVLRIGGRLPTEAVTGVTEEEEEATEAAGWPATGVAEVMTKVTG